MQRKYSPEFKLSVIMDLREHHLSFRETARKYNLVFQSEDYAEKSFTEEPSEGKPSTDKPSTENPSMVLPVKEKPLEENPWLNNTKINKKENNNILYNNTKSNPIPSKNKMSELDIYRKDVKENIEYDILVEKEPLHKDMIDEIVELMAETLSSKKEEITIASDTHSMTDVRKRYADINSEHIE